MFDGEFWEITMETHATFATRHISNLFQNDVKNILKCLEKHLNESLPRLTGHSSMSGKNKERNYWLKEIAERMNDLGLNKEREREARGGDGPRKKIWVHKPS